ncbi:ACT domain-containing protein [Alkalibacter mobilis]|uniref:ACT domain-containing protein n=1 Tax=Alkalibacter mobilis TaxID=2787712 RepID=UPI0018A0608D|nr:ACT domain-containing protein [Alkalibacter mobilis]MBF7097053.1 ACT domain-containing protein [Alkalibacter mobilis]
MLTKYLIVSKEILPEYFDKVIEARNLVETGKKENISEAVKAVGISRSTYYKYKDYIFSPSTHFGRKATLSFVLEHKKGVLSHLLNTLADVEANILTINQDIPINNHAIVNITLDILEMNISMDQLIDSLKKTEGITKIKLLTIE